MQATSLLLVGSVFACVVSLAQNSAGVDLTAPSLSVHGTLPQNNMPIWHEDLVETVLRARTSAVGTGLANANSFTVSSNDEGGMIPTTQQLAAMLQRAACAADLIVSGHPNQKMAHLTPSKMSIYTDYDFAIDQVIKNNVSAPVSAQSHIVVTRLGGVVQVTTSAGSITINMELDEYPPLDAGTDYLIFLGYIPKSGAYQLAGPNAMLLAKAEQWMMARKAYSTLVLPELSRARLSAGIANRLKSCPP